MLRKGIVKASICLLLSVVIIISACKKEIKQQQGDSSLQKGPALQSNSAAASAAAAPYCREDVENGSAYDTILKPTILGARLVGLPYSVATMQQASRNLTGGSASIRENKWYVRFKPANPSQLAVLEDLDIDLFDYPLDYELVQEGDYYNDGVTLAEQIPWLYAVVDANFTPPSGITYELLQRMYVPNDYRLENEAFRITGNNVDTAGCSTGALSTLNEECDCSLRSSALECDCRVECGFNPCLTPLPPVPVVRVPVAHITVTDDVTGAPVPVRNARMVARRFLKVERIFTDNNGNCRFTKSFRNRVTLILKFKNDNAIIKGLRGARLWQILQPVKINLGQHRGDLNNIFFNVPDNDDLRSRGARHWAAATTHNAVQEYLLDRAPIERIGLPPNKLRVLVVPGSGAGSAPMFAKRLIANLPDYFIRQFILYKAIVYPLTLANGLASVLANRVDVTIGYNRGNDINTSNNDQMAELCYHEFVHAAYYNKVGNTVYGNFVQAEIAEMTANFGGAFSPYGRGNTANSGIIALGESIAYHLGHFMADRKYGGRNIVTIEQQFRYLNNQIQDIFGNPVAATTLNAHLNLLEDFSPRRTVEDPFF